MPRPTTLPHLRRAAAPIASATVLAFVGTLLSPIVARAQQEPPAFTLPRAPDGSAPPAVYDQQSLDALEQHFDETGAPPAAPPPELPPTDDEVARTLAALPTGGGAISPQAAALPSGAATQLGMGESFTTQLSTGGVAYAVPLALPSARGGVQPRLDLSYNSGGGYGIAGVGWSVGAAAIQRQTDRGLPSYDDSANGGDWHPNQDRFIFGGTELVPICTVNGGACSGALPTEVMPVWANGWQYFRSRIESGFLRFFWSPDHQTWRIQGRDGTNMELGVPLDGTGYEGALERNPDRPSEIFRWYVARQYDTQGSVNTSTPAPYNTIYYRYLDDAGATYLSDIYDTSPAANPTTTNLASFAHHTRLRYEPRPDIAISYRAGWLTEHQLRLIGVDVTSKTTEGGPNAPRELVRRYHISYDPTSHRSLLVAAQMEGRCSTPVQEGGSDELPDTSCPRLPAVRFEYQRIQGSDPLHDSQGYAYEPFNEQVYRHANSPAHSLDEALSELMDVNADGLTDLLVTAPGLYGDGHALFLNGRAPSGDYGFGDVLDMGLVAAGEVLDPGGLMLNNPNVVPMDLDADGIVNLAHMPHQQSYSVFHPAETFPGSGQFQWVGREASTYDGQDVKIDFTQSSRDTQVMDVNADGLVDIVYSSPTEVQTYLSLGRLPDGADRFGQGSWATASTSNLSTEPIRACAPWSAQPVRFSDADTRVADMNGDGLADIVRLRSGQILYWPGRGNGFWGTGDRDDCVGGPGFATDRHIAMMDAPAFGPTLPGSLQLADVNGDGLTDMVEFRNQGVDIYLNDSGIAWTERHIISDTPFLPSASNYIRLTDIDGSGTPDILWGRAHEYDYIDLTGGASPHLLTKVHNGLGKTLELEYESSTAHMLAAEAAGNPWTDKAPVTTPVLVRSTVRDNLDRMGRAPGVYVTEYTYRNAVYEGRQREFRGFREAVTHVIGDSNAPDAYQRSSFLLGECPKQMNGSGYDVCSPEAAWRDNWREALKGLPIISESFDAAGVYMSTEHTRFELRQLYTGRDGRRVVVPLPTFKDVFLYDTASFDSVEDPQAGWTDVDVNLTDLSMSGAETRTLSVRATAGTAHVQSQTEYDDFGNTLIATRYGCIEGCLGGGTDETLTAESEFDLPAGDGSGWLYRETSSFIAGENHSELRNQISHTYDSRGQLTQSHGALSGTLALDRFHAASGTIAPAPTDQSAGITGTAQLLLVTNTYDEFGHIAFKRLPNHRCSSESADPDYAHLPVVAHAYAGPLDGGTGCGELEFTHHVTYDRGLEAVVDSVSPTGAPSHFVYDGFGRLTSSFGPDPDAPGQLCPNPNTQVTYHLPANATTQPYSMSEVRVLEAPSCSAPSPGYRLGYRYIDGLGRELASLTQADMSAGDGGQWVVNGDVIHNARGLVAQECYPWFWSGNPIAYPLSTPIPTQCTTQEYDAFGRAANSYDACGKHTGHVDHHALSTDAYDGNDLVDGTYLSNHSDGHGRGIRRTERILNGSTFEERYLINEYSPTGEVERVVQRKSGATDRVRWLKYDSLGRMVLNVEPNTSVGFNPDPSTNPSTIKAWRYAYNDSGDVVGVSDARGCGANYHYDTGGRLLAVDRSPCTATQPVYSAPNLGTGVGTEGFYRYDYADPATGTIVDASGIDLDIDTSQLWGRVASVWGTGSKAVFAYDGLGRSIGGALQVQRPGTPHTDPTQRYAPRWYVTHQNLDTLGRVEVATTGAPVDELRGADGTSQLEYTYTARGVVRHVQSSYGLLFDGAVYDAEGKPLQMTLGDPGETQRQLTYTCRREVKSAITNRSAVPLWSSPGYQSGTSMSDPTQQVSLEHYEYDYDYEAESLGHGVGNITSILDMRDPGEWPIGSKPVDRHFEYDDLYRLTKVTYDYGSSADSWRSPYDRENQDVANSTTDPSHPLPSPHQSFATRIQEQTYEYDWLGNLTDSGDDLDGFWDRSTGTRDHGTASAGPHQLLSASNRATSSSTEGDLDVAYDAAGNVTDLIVRRDGACLPTGSSCWQRFRYEWDELGQLSRARRWDLTTAPDERTDNGDLIDPIPSRSADADLNYHYDDGGSRILKTATDADSNTRHTVYITGGLELRSTVFDTMAGDYALDPTRVTLRLPAGPAVARVLHNPNAPPKPSPDASLIDQYQHVFLEMADHLGSNTFVIDLHSSELVEFSTYQAYGAIESDYRPSGWDDYREPFKFSGKEEDIEVGLAYFGARYYSPYLNVWISPDPVTLHDLGSDTNPYSYVAGRPIMAVDPDGRMGFLLSALVGAIVGAVLGFGSSVVTQAAANGWDFGKINWGIKGVLGATVMGALGGMLSGGVGSLVANALPATATLGAKMAASIATGVGLGAANYGIGAAIGAYEPTIAGFVSALVGGAAGGAMGGALGCGFWEGLAGAGAGGAASYLTSSSITGDWSAKSFALSLGGSVASAAAGYGLGQVCFVKGTLVTMADGTQKPIDEVELGERVLPDDEACRELDVSGWVQVELDPGEDGYVINVLRPRAWAETYSLETKVFFDLPEVNFRGWATVARILEGPSDVVGVGCPVTGSIRRRAPATIGLELEGSTEPIGVTPSHPLYSASRGGWIAAGGLVVDEEVLTLAGAVRVSGLRQGSGDVPVFNIEVSISHRYFVGPEAVLAHNQCFEGSGETVAQEKAADTKESKLDAKAAAAYRKERELTHETKQYECKTSACIQAENKKAMDFANQDKYAQEYGVAVRPDEPPTQHPGLDGLKEPVALIVTAVEELVFGTSEWGDAIAKLDIASLFGIDESTGMPPQKYVPKPAQNPIRAGQPAGSARQGFRSFQGDPWSRYPPQPFQGPGPRTSSSRGARSAR